VRLGKTESALVRSQERDSLLVEGVERFMTIPAVGPITALTWALEVGEVQRFPSIKKSRQLLRALWSRGEFGEQCAADAAAKTAQQAFADTDRGGKMAPRNSPELALLYDKEKGNANRATLAVARKLVAYLVAVDRRQKECLTIDRETRTVAGRREIQGGFLRRVAC